MPVIEGLACGARPIVFDRPDMTHWYEGHAVFIPECSGPELVEVLTDLLKYNPTPVKETERAEILARFDWSTIVKRFWEYL
jgi:glycosyltransferase involved in cell wall biosynthesis